jgi:hypothetical protein
MAHFLDSDERLIQAALNERRLVMLAAPRRSGLTFWCQRAFGGLAVHKGWTQFIDLSRYPDNHRLRSEFARCLSVRANFQKTEEILADWESNQLSSGQPTLVIFLNAHRAVRTALTWLVRTLIELTIDVRSKASGFVIEGSTDPDAILEESFPDGPPAMPLVRYAEPAAPWRILVEIEEIRRVRFNTHSDLLSPWLADSAGGDVHLTVELFEKIPVGPQVTQEQIDEALTAALKRGATATEMNRSAQGQEPSSKELLLKLCAGQIIHTGAPPYFPSQELKQLYLLGLATYDPVVAGYRLRSTSVLGALKARNSLDGLAQVSPKESIGARTTVLLAYVAAAELQLRSHLPSQDLEKLATEVFTSTEFGKIGAELKRKLIKLEGLQSRGAEINKICEEVIPERQTVLSAAEARAPSAQLARSHLADYVTLNELSLLAKKAEVLDTHDDADVTLVNKARNNLAHFRAATFSAARDVVEAVQRLLKRLSNGRR